jgi:hypothetical protein
MTGPIFRHALDAAYTLPHIPGAKIVGQAVAAMTLLFPSTDAGCPTKWIRFVTLPSSRTLTTARRH